MESLETLEDIAGNPCDYARRWKEKTGRPVVGYLCSYVPEEILHAAGALPFRLLGDSGQTAAADAHLQAYSCSLVRSALSEALTGRLDFLSGVVFAHTCDAMQRLSDIWRLNTGIGFHLDLALPVKLDTDSARQYMSAVVRRFFHELQGALAVEITADRLAASVATFNRIRTALDRLYRIRQEHPGALDSARLHRAVRASMIADRERLPAALEMLAADLQGRCAAQDAPIRKRVVFSGGMCRIPDIYRIVEAAGAAVVDDDLCTGRRFFEGVIQSGKDPVSAIADRYADRIVCPAKHRGTTARADHLVSRAKESRADGVIFYALKFCDPHGFDYPYLKERLDREGIASLLLEVDEPDAAGGQLQTRVEAFIETL